MFEISTLGIQIALVSCGVTLFTSIVRHYTLDKAQMKEHKEKVQKVKDKVKAAQKAQDTKAMQKHQSEMMELSMGQMRSSFKPMMYTFIPLILIFSMLRAQYGVVGALTDVNIIEKIPEQFNIQNMKGSLNWTYDEQSRELNFYIPQIDSGLEGVLDISYRLNSPLEDIDEKIGIRYSDHNGSTYRYIVSSGENQSGSDLYIERTAVTLSNKKLEYGLKYVNRAPYTVSTVLGYPLGWLGTYILFSFISSMIFNKLFGNN